MADSIIQNNRILEMVVTGTTTAAGTGTFGINFLVSQNKVINVLNNNTDRVDIHIRQDDNRYYFSLSTWGSTEILTNYDFNLTVFYILV